MTARRSALPYELIEPGDGRRARIRFTGLFQGRQVVWDAEVVSLAGSARQQFIEVGRHTRYGLSLTVGLHTPVIDEPVLRKTVIMIRQYKRLGHTRHEFGDTAGPAPAEAPVRPAKLLSGGQTGVDRAALDAALALGIPCGGWCPQGRRAEDGQIPARYPLTETGSPGYRERTYLNVRDSDGTLILARGALSGGTTLTRRVARAGQAVPGPGLGQGAGPAIRARMDAQSRHPSAQCRRTAREPAAGYIPAGQTLSVKTVYRRRGKGSKNSQEGRLNLRIMSFFRLITSGFSGSGDPRSRSC